MSRLTPPYFDRSNLVKDARGRLRAHEPATKEMKGVEIGEDWTRLFIGTQASFLGRHGENHQRNASWMLAMAGCMANNETTEGILDQARRQGLSFEDIFTIAASQDSDVAIEYIHKNNVNFTSLMVPGHFHVDASSNTNVNMPSRHFTDHLHSKSAVEKKKTTILPSVEVILMGERYLRPQKCIAKMIALGVINPSERIQTNALGFSDGKAFWSSIAIANGNHAEAALFFDSFKLLSQEVLDEALLACAMKMKHHRHMDDGGEISNLSKSLFERGANPDQMFEFDPIVMHDLNGYFSLEEGDNRSCAREWGVAAFLTHDAPVKFLKAVMPAPWPAKNKDQEWGYSIIDRCHQRSGSGQLRQEPTNKMLGKAFSLLSKENPEQILRNLQDIIKKDAQKSHYLILDAMLESKPVKKLKGTLSYSDVIELIDLWATPKLLTKSTPGEVRKNCEDWWASKRMMQVIRWMPEKDAVQMEVRVNEIGNFINEKSFEWNDRNANAVKMKIANLMESEARLVPPIPKRRTL